MITVSAPHNVSPSPRSGQDPLPISVVIPFFDGHETIGRAFRSLERQTRPPQEIVLVDDCSKSPFDAATFPSGIRLTVLRNSVNRGIPSARNLGIRSASAKWIAFLDHDDEWAPDRLERQWEAVNVTSEPETAIFYDRCLWLDLEKGKAEKFPLARSIDRITAGGIVAIRELLSQGNVVPFITLLLHKNVFASIGFLDETLTGGSDDYEFVIRALEHDVRLVTSARNDLSRYSAIHHVTGSNYSNGPGLFADDLAVFAALSERHPQLKRDLNKAMARVHFRTGRFYEEAHKDRLATYYYRHALVRDWLAWKTWMALFSAPAPRAFKRVLHQTWIWAKSIYQS